MRKTEGRRLRVGLVLAAVLLIVGLAASPPVAAQGDAAPCDETRGFGRVARDGDTCVILDTLLIAVAHGSTVDQAAAAVEQRAGWTVARRLDGLKQLIAEHVPDTLTLAELKAEQRAIEGLPEVEYVDLDTMASAATGGTGGGTTGGTGGGTTGGTGGTGTASGSSGRKGGGSETAAESSGSLENPGPHAFQSGIGVISGWVCTAEAVEIVIETADGRTISQEAGYGTERRDTAAACGDTDNGFGLLVNWNLLGDGEHEVVAFVDDVELGRATVTVTTLGAEFVRGVTGTCEAPDFPMVGETGALVWQETQQNFVLVDGARPRGTNRAGSAGVGYLENPGPDSFQSGIGVISGWVCEGDVVLIALNGVSQPAAYGTERRDTLQACGDTDNGFGLLFNWNLLGDGEHEVVAYVDDMELGRATVRVTTLGEEFVREAEGECVVEDFPALAQTVTLEWHQTSQNFVIVDYTADAATAPPAARAAGGSRGTSSGGSRGTSASGRSTPTAPQNRREPAGGDLAVTAPSVSEDTLEAGAPFTLSATVRNDGDGAAAATTLRFYRSTDATITATDTAVGTAAVAGLAASGTSSESIALTAPSTPGTYYYGACVDAVTDESDTTNTCSPAGAVTVTVTDSEPSLSTVPPPTPDLVVESPSVSDTGPAAGAAFTLSATVRNDGDGESPATTLRYYRSPDATITATDTAVGTDAVGALAAQGTGSESIALTAPSSPGPYYYGACIAAVTDESDTTNNCSSSIEVTVLITQQQGVPDLVVGTLTITNNTPETGESDYLFATVTNTGDGESAATTLRFYRSPDATITATDTEVGTDAVGALAAAGSLRRATPVTAPAQGGTYYYGACVDAVTDESDMTNNCSPAVTVTVSGPEPSLSTVPQTAPDLVVLSPRVSNDRPAAGAGFTISATVRNDGNGASPATTLRFYRSTVATITRSDTAMGAGAVGGSVASASAGASVDLRAPSSPGTYYYGACVDAVAGEAATTNNCSTSVAVRVTVSDSEPSLGTIPPPAPDLVVSVSKGVHVTSTLRYPQGAFKLSATVRNDGSSNSAAATLRFYRSTDVTITTSDTEIDTHMVYALSPSGTSTKWVWAPKLVQGGTYYYGACVDAVTGESATTNNCSSSFSVTVPSGRPDLQMGSPTTNRSRFPTDHSHVGLFVDVANRGTGRSPTTTLRAYRSTDTTITTEDVQVGTAIVPVVSPRVSQRMGIGFTTPSSPGDYHYGACVDAVADESNTTNNCSSAVTIWVFARWDVEVGSLMVSDSTPAPGAALTFSVTVSNNGPAWSPSSRMQYYRSTTTPIPRYDLNTINATVVDHEEVRSLAAGASSTHSSEWTAPTSPGTYYYIACVRPDPQYGESNYKNNCSPEVAVTVTP